MTKRMIKLAVITAVGFALTACATGPKLAPAGAFVTQTYSVPLKQDWTAFSIKTGKGKKAHLLSVDGPALNSVYLFSDLKEGDSLLRERKKEEPVPKYNADMSELEQMEFITDSLEKGMGLVNLITSDVAPDSFNGNDALFFNMSGVTDGGLNMSGSALVSQADEGLNIVFYLAPSEHYHGKLKDEVGGIFNALSTGNIAS